MSKIEMRKLNKNDYEEFKQVLYVFKEAPWYEKLSEQDVLDEWHLYKKSNIEKINEFYRGIYPNDDYSVFGCFVDGKLVSIVTYTLSYGNDVMHKEHGVDFNDSEIIAYIYGMATLKNHRGNGYNSMLLEAANQHFANIGIDKAYARYAINKEEISFVDKNKDQIVNGKVLYKSKSESVHILMRNGYVPYQKQGQLYVQDCTKNAYKVNTDIEDLRAFVVYDFNEKQNMLQEQSSKVKQLVIKPSVY